MIGEISEKIRALRKEQNLTLKDLSKITGLSVSFLSQVENNTSSLAITSLKRIADALGVPMVYFFEDEKEHTFHVKLEDQNSFKIENSNSEFVRLSGDFPDRILESMLVTIPPTEQHGHKFNHPGEEFVYVLEGTIIVSINGEDHIVKKGDSIHYPSTLDHLWTNPLDTPARLVSVVTPALF